MLYTLGLHYKNDVYPNAGEKQNAHQLKGVSLRDFIPWKNIGIVWRNPAMPIFLFLWQIYCTNEIPMNQNSLLFCPRPRNLFRLKYINSLY